MDSVLLKNRTKPSAVRSLKGAQTPTINNWGDHIRKPMIPLPTSVAATYQATWLASWPPFAAKIGIVIKEIDGLLCWIEIIVNEKLLPIPKLSAWLQKAKELASLIISARKIARKNRSSSITYRK